MLALRYNETVVRRVRLKCRHLDPLAAQLRLENVLQTAELHPVWLSPSAIVCVRRLHDPLPLNLEDHTASQTSAWRNALSAAVEEKLKNAARPANGETESDAVIFQDQAELLACLASDLCEGLFESRWWWRTLFKNGNIAVFTTWSNSPEYVPAALELLARKGQLRTFARALSIEDARELLKGVTESFALPVLQSVLDQGLEAQIPITSDNSPVLLRRPPALSEVKAPWHSVAPEALDPTLGVERQSLIGVSLTIRRAPAVVRSPSFAKATLNWLHAVAEESFNQQQASTEVQLHEVKSYAPEANRSKSENPAPGPGILRQGFPLSPQTSAYSANTAKELSQSSPISPAPEENATVGSETKELRSTQQPRATPFAEELSCEISTNDSPFDEVRIETDFGGVFYLINVGLFLGLYGDFTTPTETGLTLPIFDFATLTAQRLLNAKIKDDPVWGLLAQLAGRNESEPPGKGFDPPGQWRLPPRWLDAFPEDDALEWSTGDKRLRVSHPSGFLLIDLPLAADPVKQLKRELMAYDPNATRPLHTKSHGLSQSNNGLDQWLEWIVPYIRARLVRALGDDALVQRLCAHRATIRATAVHLDISFSLSEHPLELRGAGLDRDPGWVPAAGRFIRFHYQ